MFGVGYWRVVMFLFVLVAVAAGGFIRGSEHGAAEMSALSQKIGACQSNNAALSAAIDAQNESIQRAAKESEARQKLAEQSLAKAKIWADHYYHLANELMQARGSGNNCADASALFDKEIGGVE